MHLGIDPQGGISKQCEEVFFNIQFEHSLGPSSFPSTFFSTNTLPHPVLGPLSIDGP